MSQDMNAGEGGDEAQYEATKNAVEDKYERDGDHLYADGVLCGELNKGLYSRLERFEEEIKIARDDGNREFELESIEAYIRTARKLDGVDVPEDSSDGESVPMTDGGKNVEERPELLTNDAQLDGLIRHHFSESHRVVFDAAYDVQMDIQQDIILDRVEIIGEAEKYVVIAGDGLWAETEYNQRTDTWSNNTTEALVESVRDLHIDLATRVVDEDCLWDIIGATDVAVVFTR